MGRIAGLVAASTLAVMLAIVPVGDVASANLAAQPRLPTSGWHQHKRLIFLTGGAAGNSKTLRRPSQAATPRQAPAPARAETLADSVLVRFRAATSTGARRAIAKTAEARLGERVGATGYVAIETAPGRARETARELGADPRVADVELNYIRRALETPDDPLFAKSQRYLTTARFPEAWDRSHGGEGITIAVLDTGIDADHPDLVRRIAPGHDFVEGDAHPNDTSGHGTLVAGAAAAETDNAEGIAGAAWEATILPVKVLDERGEGDDARIAAGITWAVEHGADVINLSLGAAGASEVLGTAVRYAMTRGVVVVAAAGNWGDRTPIYPAAYDGVVAVTATDAAGNLAYFNSFGPWVDVAAPGWLLTSTKAMFDKRAGYTSDLDRHAPSGTSFAAPLVSGAAALVLGDRPDASPASVGEALRASARDAGIPGVDDAYGHGLLDAAAALGAPRAVPVAPSRREGEPNDTPANAPWRGFAKLSNGEVWAFFNGTLDVADHDWVRFPLGAFGRFEIHSATGIVDSEADGGRLMIEVYGPDLRLLDRSDAGFFGGRFEVYADEPGDYFVHVWSTAAARVAYGIGAKWTIQPEDRIHFLPPVHAPLGRVVTAVAPLDLTRDGRQDIVAATGDSGQLALVRQAPDGFLEAGQMLPVAAGIRIDALAAARSGSGDSDVVAASPDAIRVFRRAPEGLAAPEALPASGETYGVKTADLDADGRDDVVARAASELRLFVRSAGGWERRTLPVSADSFAVGFLDGDSLPDIAVAGPPGFRPATVTIYRRQPDGSYVPRTLDTGDIGAVDVGDVTGDGRDDVVLVDDRPAIRVYAQTASGFAPPRGYAHHSVQNPTVIDLNADGRLDVLAGEAVLVAQADGTLWGPQELETPIGHPGDVNGDGRPDGIGATSNGIAVTWQRSSTWPRPTWVRHTSPANLATGIDGEASATITFTRDLDPSSLAGSAAMNTASGETVPIDVSYEAAHRVLTADPRVSLRSGETYVLTVAGVRDSAGRPMAEPYSFRFTIAGQPQDVVPPETWIIDAPFGVVNYESAFREAVSNEPGVTFECLSSEPPLWRPCLNIAGDELSRGEVHIEMRAVDPAGNVDPTPARHGYTVDFDLQLPANGQFSAAQAISGASGSASGPTHGGGSDVCDIAGADSYRFLWYRWSAPTSGRFSFETSGSNFDTVLGVYPTPTTCIDVVAENDDAVGSRTSRVVFHAQAGTEYVIGVGGFEPGAYAQSGTMVLRWRPAGAEPSVTSPPAISGTPAIGHALQAFGGTWAGEEPVQLTYRWRRCSASGSPCGDIPSARGATYVVTPRDVGHALRVSVRAVNPLGVAWALSQPVAVPSTQPAEVAASPTPPPLAEPRPPIVRSPIDRPTPRATVAPRARFVTKRLQVTRRGVVAIVLRCVARRTQRCRGSVQLTTWPARERIRVGSARFSIRGGTSATVRVRLTTRALTRLRRAGSLRVRAIATVRNGTVQVRTSSSLVLRR